MKKTIFVLILIQLGFNVVFSQNSSSEIKYSATGLYVTLTDSAGNTLTKVPMGKNVTITYDSFFKSYLISFTSKEGTTETMRYDYVSDDKNGGFNFVMKDTFGNVFYVTDNLTTTGKLLITPSTQKKNKPISFFIVEGAVKTD